MWRQIAGLGRKTIEMSLKTTGIEFWLPGGGEKTIMNSRVCRRDWREGGTSRGFDEVNNLCVQWTYWQPPFI